MVIAPNMSQEKTLSGQLPLMQVFQQPPKKDQDQTTDSTTLRLNFHTFAESRTYSSSKIAHDQSVTGAQYGVPQIPQTNYKRIAFTAANYPGQPTRKKQRTTQSTNKSKPRSLKPLPPSLNMHADAWSIILAHTRPAFVMQMRTVSKFFYHITNTDTIWRHAREHHFGADMPPRPSFLTERQYAALLDGRGCQNPNCERRETRKVRWVFRLRLCDDCLSCKLQPHKPETGPSPQSRYASLFQNSVDRDRFGTNFADLLPSSGTWSGKPNGPRGVNRETGQWSTRFVNTNCPLLYLKSDYAELETEYEKIIEEDWEPQRVLEWVEQKYRYAVMVAQTASDIEKWEFVRWSEEIHGTGSTRYQRKEYFLGKALQVLHPVTGEPMSEEVLNCFAAYHASLASSNHPTERAWDTLLPKMLPYRSQAEHVAHYWSTRGWRPGQPNNPTREMLLFDRLHDRRRTRRKETGKWSPEQKFVLEIAEVEFSKLLDQVADEDVLLLCLRNVYETYQNRKTKPHGLNFDAFDGKLREYRLSLDDAKLVVEEIIEKRIKKSTLRGVKVLESLRCMGCTRFTSGRRYSFQSAFEHMLEKHGRRVGKDLYFYRFCKYSKIPPDGLSKDYRFPWYLVEWTKSLPILPTHALVTSETRWDPDEKVDYIQSNTPTTVSAFEGRHAVAQPDVSCDDFVSNFVHAIKCLSTTRLDPECIVKIAIRYSLELTDLEPTIEDFFECIKPTQDLGLGISFKFRCGACNRRPDVNSHLRCVKHAVDINTLRKHWDDKHDLERIDWSIYLMDLPSDNALLDMMHTQDEKLRQDQAISRERETIGLKKSAKKIRDQKASALMQKEMSVEAFGRLFAYSE